MIPPGNGAIRDPRRVHFSSGLSGLRQWQVTLSAMPAPAHSLETTFESLDAMGREITVAWSVFMNGRCLVASPASMSGDHAVYALFMKLDDVKYGLFMRIDTHKTQVVAELRVTPPIQDSRALAGKGVITSDLEQNCSRPQAARQPPLRRGLSARVLSNRARKDSPSSSSRRG
jgi:hypothetical protein